MMFPWLQGPVWHESRHRPRNLARFAFAVSEGQREVPSGRVRIPHRSAAWRPVGGYFQVMAVIDELSQ